jgi:hypothetical protein
MTANDVIEAYVLDVMRRVPSKDRQDIGLELRGLLAEMLAERAAEGAKPANEAMALAMVRSFGAPADVAARYAVPGLVIIPAAQTRSFAVLLWLAGLGLLAVLLVQGRWTVLTRRLDLAGNLAWVALLLFWLSAGPIFTSPATDSGARGGIGLVILFVALDLGVKWNRQRGRLPMAA